MDFKQAISIISDTLKRTGTEIMPDRYDGIIVKKLESSNTLDEGRTTNQTHIAFTGSQMDIFPYLRSDGYFEKDDAELKKYFIMRIPICLDETNVKYLDDEAADNIVFSDGKKHTVTSVVRSKRQNQADQLQVSLLNIDGADFVAFRHMLQTGSYLIIIKVKRKFEYEAYGIKAIDGTEELQKLNNQFFKSATSTPVDVADLEKSDASLRQEFETYITDVLKLKSTRQVRDLAKLSNLLCDAGVLEKDVYCITDVDEYRTIVKEIKNSNEYQEDKNARKEISPNSGLPYDQGLTNYERFLIYRSSIKPSVGLRFATGIKTLFSRNRIIFGAPGTGKSYTLNEERKELLGADNENDYERVTFHPDYSYANFVGTYKPIPCKNDYGEDAITYEYVPGPFMRVYVNALKSAKTEEPKPYLLIIEEINRANVAAVFGDVFQLLDRNGDEVSEYPIQASEDIKKYLAKELGGNPEDYNKIKIPDNMFIWATMNSADQGVFPMDTAFKRRWDFTYIGINQNDYEIKDKYVCIGKKPYCQKVYWNKLRKAINKYLAEHKINEDKQLGPYFLSRKIVISEGRDEIDKDKFCEAFKNKVIMYLFEDAAKQKRDSLFSGVSAFSNRYSQICEQYDKVGIGIFNEAIRNDAEPENVDDDKGNPENSSRDENLLEGSE